MSKKFTVWWLVAMILASFEMEVAKAVQIPIGLDSGHGVFVQEYWLQGTPQYCIANTRPSSVTLRISQWRSRTDPPLLLKEITIPADSVTCFDVSAYRKHWLLLFEISDGTRLGLLRAPRLPPDAEPPSLPVAVHQILNGACGGGKVWLELPDLWEKAGGTFTARLHRAKTAGAVQFRPSEGEITLPRVEIAAPGNIPADAPESMELTLKAPSVRQPKMVVISGRARIPAGWQCFVFGIPVKP